MKTIAPGADGVADAVMAQCLDAQTLNACFPHDSAVIPRAGRWILVREVPHTALPWEVPLYSIWRARRVIRRKRFRVTHHGGDVMWPMTLAEIATPGGDLVLYPSEYVGTTIEKWLDLLGDGVTMHFVGESIPDALTDPMFYLQAHGLSRRAAAELMLPGLAASRFVYFTLDWETA